MNNIVTNFLLAFFILGLTVLIIDGINPPQEIKERNVEIIN